jgi:uncharacterized protein YggU (UPF0235/DUF167 family)
MKTSAMELIVIDKGERSRSKQVKIKVKFVPEQAMKAHRGSSGIAERFL